MKVGTKVRVTEAELFLSEFFASNPFAGNVGVVVDSNEGENHSTKLLNTAVRLEGFADVMWFSDQELAAV